MLLMGIKNYLSIDDVYCSRINLFINTEDYPILLSTLHKILKDNNINSKITMYEDNWQCIFI
jgi:hypothetical protein